MTLVQTPAEAISPCYIKIFFLDLTRNWQIVTPDFFFFVHNRSQQRQYLFLLFLRFSPCFIQELADLSTRQASENKNLLKQQQLKNLEEKYAMLITQVRELSIKKKSTLNHVVQILSYVAAVILLVIIIVRITGSSKLLWKQKKYLTLTHMYFETRN